MAHRFSVRMTYGATASREIAPSLDNASASRKPIRRRKASDFPWWRRREQQEIRRCLGQGVAELETGNLLGAATQPVGFIDDNQIPAGGDQVLEPLTVMAGELVLAPA